jgi:hypothetical protein
MALNQKQPVGVRGHPLKTVRYARQVERTVFWNVEFDDFVWEELEILRKDRERATGIKWAIDHMYPVKGEKVSGLHTASNWQLIPSWMNNQKSRRPWLCNPDEWILCINRPVLLAFWGWRTWRKLEIIQQYEDGMYG